jgi:hypothetical protein
MHFNSFSITILSFNKEPHTFEEDGPFKEIDFVPTALAIWRGPGKLQIINLI